MEKGGILDFDCTTVVEAIKVHKALFKFIESEFPDFYKNVGDIVLKFGYCEDENDTVYTPIGHIESFDDECSIFYPK